MTDDERRPSRSGADGARGPRVVGLGLAGSSTSSSSADSSADRPGSASASGSAAAGSSVLVDLGVGSERRPRTVGSATVGVGSSASPSASCSSVVRGGRLGQGGGLLLELLEGGDVLVAGPQRRGLGGQPGLGQRDLQLVGGHVEGLAHHVVGREQPVAAGLEPLDLLAERLAATGQVVEHPLADLLGLGHHLAAFLATGLDLGGGVDLGLG